MQRRAKKPVGVPDKELARPVTKVGIVGAGLMASQLAMLFARRLQVPVVMTDLDQERVDAGVGRVHADIDALAAKGRLSADKASRLKGLVSGSTDVAAFAGAEFILEAVFEDLSVKKEVFAAIEDVVSDTCILATNTSSLSVTAMASICGIPSASLVFTSSTPSPSCPCSRLRVRRRQMTHPLRPPSPSARN